MTTTLPHPEQHAGRVRLPAPEIARHLDEVRTALARGLRIETIAEQTGLPIGHVLTLIEFTRQLDND